MEKTFKIPFTRYQYPPIGTVVSRETLDRKLGERFINEEDGTEIPVWEIEDSRPFKWLLANREVFQISARGYDFHWAIFEVLPLDDEHFFVTDYSLGYKGFGEYSLEERAKIFETFFKTKIALGLFDEFNLTGEKL